ncbi:MAG: DUF3488 and transglutaminase-like domain-containing protein [Actinomycetota bacterium]|nr:DUF3488 and transglutaminase-like domain-containing protein [Actinomycetota bacterium]
MTESWSSLAKLALWAWLASVAAAASLAPLVTPISFLVTGGVAGLIVAAVGAASRRLQLPVAVVLIVQLFALLIWATVSYASEAAWAGVVPTRESMAALIDVVASALATAQEYAPPAPATDAVAASLAFVVGAVALVVDLVAVSWRRPALVGLVFLGIYMTPVSLLAGEVPVLAFAPGALAFVFLLAAEQRDRVTHWGRQISISGALLSARDRQPVAVSTLVESGRRVGLGAVALAVVLPLLIPTLPRTFLADGPLTADGAGGGGDGTVDLENPLLDLRRNLGERTDDVLVTMTTNGDVPRYLRIASLDTFTDDSWKPSERTEETATSLSQVPDPPPGLLTPVERDRVASRITVSSRFNTTWLPTLYPVTSAEAAGDWSVDAAELDISARSDDLNAAGLSYDTVSTLVLPTASELTATGPPSANMEPYLDLPADMSPAIADLADSVTARQPSRYEEAEALQNWFRTEGGFEYSLEPGPGDGLETIENFLTEQRRGYCEQYAASMALMARSLGIPSRVAVGFLRPELAGEGRWEFQGVDMHAWPELYFEGVGWVLFEPTPAVRTGAAPDRGTGPGVAETTANTGRTQTTRDRPQDEVTVPPADAGSTDGGASSGYGQRLVWGAGVLLLAVVTLAAPRTARAARRARRWRRAGPAADRTADRTAEVAWVELTDTSADLGVPVDQRSTLRTSGRELRSLLHEDAGAIAALNRLVIDVERSRFAPAAGAAPRSATASRRDVDEVTDRLAAGRTSWQRRRSVWLPISLLPRHGWHTARGGDGPRLLRTEEPRTEQSSAG